MKMTLDRRMEMFEHNYNKTLAQEKERLAQEP